MSLASLTAAEWAKAVRRPALRAVLALAGALGVLFLIFLLLRHTGAADRERLREFLSLPAMLEQASRALNGLGKVLVVLVAASVFGAEFAFDTWKTLLPQRPGRSGFLIAKALAAIGFSGIVAVALVAGFLLPSLPLAAWVGAPQLLPEGDNVRTGVELACFAFELLAFTGITGGATMLTRSTLGGIAVGMFFVILLGPIASADPLAATVLPGVHVDNLRALLGGDQEALDAVQMAFEAEVSLARSLMMVVAYLTVPLAAAAWVFERRDLAAGH